MPAPDNYNSRDLVIDVDPGHMWSVATVVLPDGARLIINSLNQINGIWAGLQVGWAGVTADEAQDFGHRWNTTMTYLFGSADEEDSGLLPKIAKGLGLAAINYGEAEDSVQKMFKGFSADGGGDGSDQRNDDEGPVTEHTDPYPSS